MTRSKPESFAEWGIPTKDVGFYHLDVALEEGGRPVLRRQFPMTVLPRQQGTARGEFGISLPVRDQGLELYERLLEYSGCRWSKLPLWGPRLPPVPPPTKEDWRNTSKD